MAGRRAATWNGLGLGLGSSIWCSSAWRAPHLDLLGDQRLGDRDADAEHVARPAHVPGDMEGQPPDPRPERRDEPREEISEGVEAERREDRGRHLAVLRASAEAEGTCGVREPPARLPKLQVLYE